VEDVTRRVGLLAGREVLCREAGRQVALVDEDESPPALQLAEKRAVLLLQRPGAVEHD